MNPHNECDRKANGTGPTVAVPWLSVLAFIGTLLAPPSARSEWLTFGPRDGHSGIVRDAFEDRSGTIWFATDTGGSIFATGASIYDGVRFTDLRCCGQLFALTEDAAGVKWIATQSGIVKLPGGDVHSFPEPYQSVTSAAADHLGRLWVGTVDGLGCSDSTAWKTYTTADGLADNYVVRVAVDHAGNVWAATIAGVSRFDGTTWTTVATPPGFPSSSIQCITEDRAGNLWFGTPYGACQFDGVAWKTYTTADGLPSNFVQTIAVDHRGNIWFGTALGVSRFDGHAWKAFDIADDPTPRAVTKIFEDHLGGIWFATGDGLARSDGTEWARHPSAYAYEAVIEDHAGNIWCGGRGAGANKYDGTSWTTYTTANGLADNDVLAIAAGRTGDLWFGTPQGLSRFDGTNWTTYTKTSGLASDSVNALVEDDSGNIWAGTSRGASRFDGAEWKTYTAADGLLGERVAAIIRDREGGLLFGSELGVSRFDGAAFTALPPVIASGDLPVKVWDIAVDRDGRIWVIGRASQLGGNVLYIFGETGWNYGPSLGPYLGFASYASLLEDSFGSLWVGAYPYGVFRLDNLDNTDPLNLTTADGLPSDYVWAMTEDHEGNLWFAGNGGVARHTPDRVPPRTFFLNRPDPVSTSRNASAAFTAALGETRGIMFSTRVDEEQWSWWSPVGTWTRSGIPDGIHTLEIRAHDEYGNLDTVRVVATFDVDATPPAPLITAPAYGSPVRGVVPIHGTASDPRFSTYSVDVRPVGAPSWNFPAARHLITSFSPVTGGLLAEWNASNVADGRYEIRLVLSDALGVSGTTITTVVIDNHAPFLDETVPVKVTATAGGDVYTTNAETHLYFPPNAFTEDAVVMITAADPTSVPATLPSGAAKVLDGFDLSWVGPLKKPARFTMSYAGVSLPPGKLALYHSPDGSTWERLGGTMEDNARSISLAVTNPGRYALFSDNGLGAGTALLSSIAFTPRVFSPTGAFADRQVGISFRLGKPSPVTVKVFSKSGRLIREVATGLQLNAGDNLIRWDGTDRNGGYAVDGLYLVTVEALGQTQTKTLAVVK